MAKSRAAEVLGQINRDRFTAQRSHNQDLPPMYRNLSSNIAGNFRTGEVNAVTTSNSSTSTAPSTASPNSSSTSATPSATSLNSSTTASTSTSSPSTTNSSRSSIISGLESQISALSETRNLASPENKGNFARRIIALQKDMIRETARQQGWNAPISSATAAARTRFLNALRAVVNEAERFNRTGVYREGITANKLQDLQDSMDADFMKLIGTQSGMDLRNEITNIARNLTQTNRDFINDYTGVIDIVYSDYAAELNQAS